MLKTIRKANPSLDHLPSLKARILEEREEARHDPDALASFKALRLNMRVSDVDRAVLLVNAALGVPAVGPGGGVAIPWRMLLADNGPAEHRSEDRAFSTTTNYAGPIAQRPILQRLFGMDIMDPLGVRIDSVPAGRTEWPLITGGVAPAQKAEGTAADAAVAVTFAKETLKPKRLTGKYEYTHEMSAQVSDLEPALRRDMATLEVPARNLLKMLTGHRAARTG